MTKKELMNYIFINSNQYFIGIENFEIKKPVLDGLVHRALNIYGQYKEVEILIPIFISSYRTQLKEIEDEFGNLRQVKNIKDIYMSDYRTFPIDNRENFKIPFQWKFDTTRKVLSTSFKQRCYIECLCSPILDDIDYQNQEFLDIMLGLTLIYIGHNRTDFILNDLPTEIRDLRDEGQELLEKTIEYLKESGNSNWYSAIL